MSVVTVEEAAQRLPDLIRQAAAEDILLIEGDIPVAKLVSLEKRTRRPGSAAHLPHSMAEDFDALPEGFEEHAP